MATRVVLSRTSSKRRVRVTQCPEGVHILSRETFSFAEARRAFDKFCNVAQLIRPVTFGQLLKFSTSECAASRLVDAVELVTVLKAASAVWRLPRCEKQTMRFEITSLMPTKFTLYLEGPTAESGSGKLGIAMAVCEQTEDITIYLTSPNGSKNKELLEHYTSQLTPLS